MMTLRVTLTKTDDARNDQNNIQVIAAEGEHKVIHLFSNHQHFNIIPSDIKVSMKNIFLEKIE